MARLRQRSRIAALGLAALGAVASLAPLAGATRVFRSPRLETLAINPADTRLAVSQTLRRGDLPAGWKGGPASTENDTPPECPWQDYSAYTVTGQAEEDFRLGPASGLLDASAELLTGVQVFATPAEAAGDLAVDERQGTAACEGTHAREIGPLAKVLFARRIAGPSVGSDHVAYLIAIGIGGKATYLTLLEFVRGRSLGTIIALNPGHPQGNVDGLAHVLDRRMRVP